MPLRRFPGRVAMILRELSCTPMAVVWAHALGLSLRCGAMQPIHGIMVVFAAV